MTRSIQLSRGFVTALLASIYILGFIITPYWILHKSILENILYLALILSIGLIWLLFSANSLQVEFSSKELNLFLLLLAAMTVLNYRALNSVIPFRGDEALHIGRTLDVVDRLPLLQTSVIIALFIAFLLAGFKKQKWALFAGILMVICVVFYFLGENLFTDMQAYPLFFLRYPFINYWFFAAAPKLVSSISSPYHEVLYRIIPFLAMAGVAWTVQRRAGTTSVLSTIAWGVAVATIPLIFYYSSILYLEPLAVFLMTIACFDADTLLHESSKDISHVPAWYALLLIGFIKETTIPFLLCFIAVRIIVQLQAWSRKNRKEESEKTLLNLLVGEFKVIFALLAPIFLYLYFRAALISTRSFTPDILNLFDLTNYYFVILSLLQQLGPFLFFFIAGCIVLFRDRKLILPFYYLATIIAILAFHMVDYRSYIGYSRFNLFILPAVLAGSIRFITWASKQRQYAASILLFIAIGSNLLFSPIHLDGAKTAYWGNYLTDTSEHYYPYQDALIWLKNNYAEERMLFAGLDFYYPFEFYWNKLDWKPKRDGIPSEGITDETLAISSILKKAEDEHYSIVVYRVKDNNFVLPRETGKFRIQVTQKQRAHAVNIL